MTSNFLLKYFSQLDDEVSRALGRLIKVFTTLINQEISKDNIDKLLKSVLAYFPKH